ncbi:MAG: hypothetical protein ACO1OB_18030 [Archangium sp.]
MKRALVLLLLISCTGIVEELPPLDSGLPEDEDAGVIELDAGEVIDAGDVDAGEIEDAGTPDSGTPDAGQPDSGTPQDAGRTARFTDDFERYDAGARPTAPWTVSTSGGTVLVDTTRAHSGTSAIKVTTDGAMSYRRAYFSLGSAFFPAQNNVFYGRMWVWLTAAPPQTTHWTHISGEGTGMFNGTPFYSYVRYGGQYAKRLMANYDSQVFQSDCWKHSMTEFPEGRWSCMEWKFDGPDNRMDFWLDGTQVAPLTVDDRGSGCIKQGLDGGWVFPQFEKLQLGWEHYQTSDPVEMWVDDVALDEQRIGCD